MQDHSLIKRYLPLACLVLSLPVTAAVQSPDRTAPLPDATELIDTQQRAEALLSKGNYLLQEGRLDDAVNTYSAALKLNPDLDEALFNRGIALGRNGDFEPAIDDLTQYIKKHPDSSVAYTKRGIRKLWQGNIQSAYQDYVKALELDKNNAEAYDDIGVIYAQWGQLGKALLSFKVATKLDPTYQKAFHNLALAHFLRDEDAQALEAVNRSLELKPDAKGALLLKSEILRRIGDNEQADALIEKAKSLPDANWTEEYDG